MFEETIAMGAAAGRRAGGLPMCRVRWGRFICVRACPDPLNISIYTLLLCNSRSPLRALELATYVLALAVTCVDPRSFYGRDLVAELRALQDESGAQRIMDIYDTPRRPYWTDIQALSLLTLTCLSSKIPVDERVLRNMGQDLKKRQFQNGTVENVRTTALVLQALIATHNLEQDFDAEAALTSLTDAQTSDGSLRSAQDSYYALAALSGTSLLNATRAHCAPPEKSERDILNDLLSDGLTRMPVVFSVRIGEDVQLGRTWNLRVPVNSSCYYVLEKISRLDLQLGVKYHVVEGKPYLCSAMGTEDDIEKGMFWFTYIQQKGADQQPKIFRESPADMQLTDEQTFIIWYRSSESVRKNTTDSSKNNV